MEQVGRLIRYHRGRLGLTQEELARRAEVGTTTVVRLEAGQIERPRTGTLQALAGALGVSGPAELVALAARLGASPENPDTVDLAGVGPFTAIYELTEDGWWVVSVPEIPGAHSQGETLEEAREMIRDAVRLLLEVRREDAERETEGKPNIVREPLEV